VGACILAGSVLWAQQSQKPVPPAPVSADLAVTFAVEHSQVVPGQSKFWFKGGGADAAVTFWKGLGLAATITGDHASNISPGVDANKLSYLGGPRYTWTAWKSTADQRRLQVFGQGLFGEAHGFDGLYPATGGATFSANSFAVQAGGGLNLYLNKSWGVRLLEADYVRTTLPNASANAQNDMRLAFGITYHIESAAPAPVTLSCAASPTTVFPGDPVTVTATAGGLNPKLNAVYSWSGAGVSGTGTTATVATAALAPGSYTVKCGVKEGKPGKEGLKPWESAEATASFNVKAFEPPTISCSASPTTIKPGETSTVTASGISPQNRPLTYTYSATAGSVSGSGASATYSSTGAPTGAVGITCTVSDDKGQTATANTGVTIAAPVSVPAPSPEIARLEVKLALHSVFFPTNLPRVATPNVGLVASQQATLDDLATDFKRYLEFKPEAHLILSGHADHRGSAEFNQALSERRVALTKQFLVDKGVPASNLETRGFGSGKNLTAVEVKALIEKNTELSAVERVKELRNLAVLTLAQNRRVDVSLSTTGQESVRQLPFNAKDFLTLIDKKPAAAKKPPQPASKK